ncbi:MAG TPA: beta-ketoacyl-ACP synthase III [Candidatus Goldiibacteriota bacterium]|nr:beta-ketoacyl-ACP synthase III [Candidatus Goldiibacteriota bacterium]
MKKAAILGTGYYAPEKVVTNFDLEKILDTTDEWISQRTGIKERHLAADGEYTSDLGVKAALKALKNANVKKEEIDFVITATITGDYIWPATANIISDKLGIRNVPSMDVSAACSGFVYSLAIAKSFIESGMYKKILVIAAEEFTKVVDWQDRSMCVLFGDGSGAAVIGESSNENEGILSIYLSSDGSNVPLLFRPGGGIINPLSQETLEKKLQFARMDGREVYKYAVIKMQEAIEIAIDKAGVTINDIDCFIFHQANKRIIDSIAAKLNIPPEKNFINIDRYANTSAATIPMALAEAMEMGKIKKGMLIGISVLGAGFTWGAAVIKL